MSACLFDSFLFFFFFSVSCSTSFGWLAKMLHCLVSVADVDTLMIFPPRLPFQVVGLEGKFEVGRKLFHGIAALSERVLSSKMWVMAFKQKKSSQTVWWRRYLDGQRWQWRVQNHEESDLSLWTWGGFFEPWGEGVNGSAVDKPTSSAFQHLE